MVCTVPHTVAAHRLLLANNTCIPMHAVVPEQFPITVSCHALACRKRRCAAKRAPCLGNGSPMRRRWRRRQPCTWAGRRTSWCSRTGLQRGQRVGIKRANQDVAVPQGLMRYCVMHHRCSLRTMSFIHFNCTHGTTPVSALQLSVVHGMPSSQSCRLML